jgi:hypothetical protein
MISESQLYMPMTLLRMNAALVDGDPSYLRIKMIWKTQEMFLNRS